MINLQFQHKLSTSLKMYVENTVINRGQAYTNGSGYFYAGPNLINGLYSYYLPYQPVIADRSIAGATIMSGIYRGSTFITSGVSGLSGINYEKGIVYFNTPITNPHTTLSGNFAIADFSVKLADQPEEILLFETKHSLKPRSSTTITGILPNQATYPIIYITDLNKTNQPYELGGTENSKNTFRLVIFADSKYALDGLTSLLSDRARCTFPLMTGVADLPYNWLGDVIKGSYNYSTNYTGRYHASNSVWIERIDSTNLPAGALSEVRKVTPGVHIGLVDIVTSTVRTPRI